MVRALRTGIMLLTLLLVVVGGTGMVSVCPCHEEIFIFSCSCHQDSAPCECHGDDVHRLFQPFGRAPLRTPAAGD